MNQLLQWLSDLVQGARLWTIVLPWERGVCVRLGYWTRRWEPGLHWRIPFLDQARVLNTRIRIVPVPCVTVTTKDGKTVTVAGTVGFQIADPFQVLLTVQKPEDAVMAISMAALAEYIVTRRTDAIDVSAMETSVLDSLRRAPLKGFEFIFAKVVDYAIVRTIRLLQEPWRPNTGLTDFEPSK